MVFALAANNNTPNIEILVYRGHLLGSLTKTMAMPGWTPKVSTLTAMLMLIGYEYRTESNDYSSIIAHINGIQIIMNMLKAECIAVVEQVQRALFWQDLLSSLVLGTSRLLSHIDYEVFKGHIELSHHEEWLKVSGFMTVATSWPRKFSVILQELDTLCRIIDEGTEAKEECLLLDNLQANIESRLVDLLNLSRHSVNNSLRPLYEASVLATYLCTYKLSVGIWDGCFVPEFCIDQVFKNVQLILEDVQWLSSYNLLLWLLFLIGGLTARTSMRKRIIVFIKTVFRTQSGTDLLGDWALVRRILATFVFSEKIMGESFLRVWEQMNTLDLAKISISKHCE